MNEFQLAAKNGDFEFIKQAEFKDIKDLINIIVENGHFKIVVWLFENHNIKNTKALMDTAAKFGHFDIVCWLQKNTFTGCTQNAVKCAIRNDHVKVVKFLYEHYPDKFKKEFTKYIKSMKLLKFFKDETKIELNYQFRLCFIIKNNLDNIKILHNWNLLKKFDQTIIQLIFTKCNIDVIDFIYTNYKTNIKKYINIKLFYECLNENRIDSMIFIFNNFKRRFNPETISELMIHFKDNEFFVYLKNNKNNDQWEKAVKLYNNNFSDKNNIQLNIIKERILAHLHGNKVISVYFRQKNTLEVVFVIENLSTLSDSEENYWFKVIREINEGLDNNYNYKIYIDCHKLGWIKLEIF